MSFTSESIQDDRGSGYYRINLMVRTDTTLTILIINFLFLFEYVVSEISEFNQTISSVFNSRRKRWCYKFDEDVCLSLCVSICAA